MPLVADEGKTPAKDVKPGMWIPVANVPAQRVWDEVVKVETVKHGFLCTMRGGGVYYLAKNSDYETAREVMD